MSTDAVVLYYWKVMLQGHLRPVYVKGVDQIHARGLGHRVGRVVSCVRLMPVKKGKPRGYSFPTTLWEEKGKVNDV